MTDSANINFIKSFFPLSGELLVLMAVSRSKLDGRENFSKLGMRNVVSQVTEKY